MSEHDIENNEHAIEYVGFGLRFATFIIDSIAVLLIIRPILYLIYGKESFTSTSLIQGAPDFILSYVFPIIAIILFWIYKSATPGKMLLSIKIVDAKTGNKPTANQAIIRYVGYYIAMFPLFLGFFWIIWDDKKQGWHDKIAGTVVISTK